MNWQKIFTRAAACIAGLAFLGFGLVLIGGQGQGEVSAILFGAFLVLSLSIGLIALAVSVWARFWHVRPVRIGGFVLIVLAVAGAFVGPKLQTAYHRYHAELKFADEEKLDGARAAAFAQLRSAIDDETEALAIGPSLTRAIREIQFRKLAVSAQNDYFHAVHAIFMTTFYDVDLSPPGQWSAPFDPAICERFVEQFFADVKTSAQKARASQVCPSHRF